MNTPRTWRLVAWVGLLLITFVVMFQLQHLVVSTARLQNDSSQSLAGVRVHIGSTFVPLDDISPGDSRFVWLPESGEATLSIEFTATDGKHKDCFEYVEGSMYHVRVTISSTLSIACATELGVFSRIMVTELR